VRAVAEPRQAVVGPRAENHPVASMIHLQPECLEGVDCVSVAANRSASRPLRAS
jgi:hypothetical protein